MTASRRLRITMLVLNDMAADARVDREASALGEAGHEVTVLALKSSSRAESEARQGFIIRRVADYTTADWKRPIEKTLQMRARTEALAEAGIACAPDVVHAHDSDTLVCAARIVRRTGARLVYDAHELYPDMISEFGARGSWPVQRYWKAVERRHIPNTDAVMTVSQGLADELARRFGVRPVVLCNVPSLRPIGDKKRLREELFLSGDPRPLLLYQGALIPGRGLDRLVDAIAQVPNVVLAVQGAGPEEEQMRAHARALDVEDRLRFMGMKPIADLHEYACGADAGVVVYEHTTLNNYLAAPNKLYQYLMAGIPLIGSDFPEIRAVIREGACGLVCDPSDARAVAEALKQLVGVGAEARAAMGARARHLAETKYNWDLEKRKLLEVYERLEAVRRDAERRALGAAR